MNHLEILQLVKLAELNVTGKGIAGLFGLGGEKKTAPTINRDAEYAAAQQKKQNQFFKQDESKLPVAPIVPAPDVMDGVVTEPTQPFAAPAPRAPFKMPGTQNARLLNRLGLQNRGITKDVI